MTMHMDSPSALLENGCPGTMPAGLKALNTVLCSTELNIIWNHAKKKLILS